jgi:hypothetical protein
VFKIVKDRRAWWKVTFKGVTEGGHVVENEISLRFFIHGEDEHGQVQREVTRLPARAGMLALEEMSGEGVSEAELEKRTLKVLSRLYAEFLPRIACDWREVGAENGDPLKFEDEASRQLLMNVPGVFDACLRGYLSCRLGGKEIREGN